MNKSKKNTLSPLFYSHHNAQNISTLYFLLTYIKALLTGLICLLFQRHAKKTILSINQLMITQLQSKHVKMSLLHVCMYIYILLYIPQFAHFRVLLSSFVRAVGRLLLWVIMADFIFTSVLGWFRKPVSVYVCCKPPLSPTP